MRTLEVHGSTGKSSILVGEKLSEFPIPMEKAVIITDTIVNGHYGKDFPPFEVIEIPTGERIKNLTTVTEIYERLLELEVDRSFFIIGIGGGVVCDIAGFVASTYLRGLKSVMVPSTLLSQVDAGVGGKNGVNLGGYKNIVGVFRQPDWVLCDISLLKTLPQRQVHSGYAEIVKHAAIGDADLFSFLEEHHRKALHLDSQVMENLIYHSLVIKASIVNRDEKENGERRILNFGHTFGHAIEKTTAFSHGEAVSVGMVIASRLSEQIGYLEAKDSRRIETLLKRLRLPIRLQAKKEEIFDAIRKDKKRNGDRIKFVLLKAIGRPFVEEIPIGKLENAVGDII
jgi:3-dehydroquinate synthase